MELFKTKLQRQYWMHLWFPALVFAIVAIVTTLLNPMQATAHLVFIVTAVTLFIVQWLSKYWQLDLNHKLGWLLWFAGLAAGTLIYSILIFI